jgi:hypothetical protein
MKKLIAAIILVSVLLIAMVVPVSASNFDYIQYNVDSGTWGFLLGLGHKDTDIGTVTVSSDSANLYIQFDTTTGYPMTMTYIGVASGSTLSAALDKFPDPPGPGQIAGQTGTGYYGDKHSLSSAHTDNFSIPLSAFTDINVDKGLVIVAIADVSGPDAGTAWASGSGILNVPTPELPAVALLGLGLIGVGGFILIKRRSKAPAIT